MAEHETYTPEALQSLAEQAPGKPVTVNFDKDCVVGVVKSAKVTDRGVEAMCVLKDGTYFSALIAPAGRAARPTVT